MGNSNIYIFGSCVTRDAFDSNNSVNIEIKQYFARQKIVSSVSKKVVDCPNSLSIKSDWLKKCVACDIEKNVWNQLKPDNPQGDYLIIDLIDERFGLGKTKNGYLTVSSGFSEGKLQKQISIKSIKEKKHLGHWYVDGIPLMYFIRKFVKTVQRNWNPKNVILHKAFFCNYYLEEGRIMEFSIKQKQSNERLNSLIGYIYYAIEKNIPGIHIIDLSEKSYIADASHKWGLAPMHYQCEYYEDFHREIIKIINSNTP